MNTLQIVGLTLFVLLAGAAMVLLPYALRYVPAQHPKSRLGRIERAWYVFRTWLRAKYRFPDLGGYVHDTAMSMWVPFTSFVHSAGAWTSTVAANVWYARRSAADASATTYIPVLLPSNSAANKGSYLQSIDLYYRVVTAALDALQADMYKVTLQVSGTLSTVAAITTTYDTGHDTAGERITVDEHKLTLTLSTPVWIDNDEQIFVEVIADAAATSLLDFFGARANFTLRL